MKLSGFTERMKKRCSKVAKIKWKSKVETEAEKLEEFKAQKLKDRDFKSLSSKEKDELLKSIAVQLGLVKDL